MNLNLSSAVNSSISGVNNTQCYIQSLTSNPHLLLSGHVYANCTQLPSFKEVREVVEFNRNLSSAIDRVTELNPLGKHPSFTCHQLKKKFASFIDDDYVIKGKEEFDLVFQDKEISAVTCNVLRLDQQIQLLSPAQKDELIRLTELPSPVIDTPATKKTQKMQLVQDFPPTQNYALQIRLLVDNDPKRSHVGGFQEESPSMQSKMGYWIGGSVFAFAGILGAIVIVFRKSIRGVFAKKPEEKLAAGFPDEQELLPLRKEGKALHV